MSFLTSAAARAVAQHAFKAADDTQVSVAAGEQVTVIEKGGNGWWRVRRDNGQEVRLRIHRLSFAVCIVVC